MASSGSKFEIAATVKMDLVDLLSSFMIISHLLIGPRDYIILKMKMLVGNSFTIIGLAVIM